MADGPIHLYGILHGTAGKAWMFTADYWEEMQFLPRSQCSFQPDPLSEEPGRGTMVIPGWLAKKNSWTEDGAK